VRLGAGVMLDPDAIDPDGSVGADAGPHRADVLS
jgi:hypothetical protein